MNFESLIAVLPGHVYWVDPHQVFLGSNESQARSFGLQSGADLVGRPLSELFPADMFEIIASNNQKVMASKTSQTFFEPFLYPDGNRAIFLSKKSPVFDIEQKVIGVLGVSFDVTAERKLEEERREMLDSLIALMPGHVYWKNKKGEFLGCNEAQAETARLTREQMIGKTDWEMPWRAMASQLRQNDLEIMRTRQSLTIDEEQWVDGILYQFLSKKVPLIDLENKVRGVLGISFDVTNQRRSEELKIQMRIANERADSMKLMASSIAHELRTPLSAIHSAMAWMKEEIPKLLQAYERAKAAQLDIQSIHPRRLVLLDRICADVSHEAASANNIINMLLVKLGQTHLPAQNLKNCSIKACLEEVFARYPFPSEEHRKLMHWESQLDFQFKGSPLLLHHVLFNLLKNSLHSIDEAGKGEIFIELRKGPLENILIFRDSGKGISAKDLPSIFERFFSKTLHGNGIGLAFCKQVMHDLGGSISCRSEEGEFAEFTLSFPKIRKEEN